MRHAPIHAGALTPQNSQGSGVTLRPVRNGVDGPSSFTELWTAHGSEWIHLLLISIPF